MPRTKSKLKVVADDKTNGAKGAISFSEPYITSMTLEGSSDLLFHRWNCEAIDEQAKKPKGSKSKKTDDVETYVWRNEKGELSIPGEYLRMAMVNAAKYKQDPRSPRKSAMDIFKAAVVSLTDMASLGTKEWDYLDRRRVTIQRAGINRTRPAMKKGWKAKFEMEVISPEYIDKEFFYEVLNIAGRLIGVGDFRPTYGRFNIVNFEIK